MNGDARKMFRGVRQRGISLLTVALLLLLLGGALMAGMRYFRAALPANLADSQKEALLWADRAILGFASIHHRLPCPAATPGGGEDCALVKGWLPARALDLDATMFGPDIPPLRYMVYGNETLLVAGEEYTHRSLTRNETVGGLPYTLPLDAYEPNGWDAEAEKDPTDILDEDAHEGRFTERYDFAARNGLDLCETLRLARTSLGLAGTTTSTDFAHYLRDAAPVNVAYGIAAPGLGSASAGADRFEGGNASDDPVMEAPDRAHGAEYDDLVFVRDLPSLMTAFGCRPVAYDIQASYQADLASGSYDGLTGGMGVVDAEDLPDIENNQLTVEYHRQGIVTPVQSSVQSVAFAVHLVEEVASQYEGVKESAEDMLQAGIIQSVLAGAAITLSSIQIAADAIGISQATTAAAACAGLCANEYVAIGFYSASLGVSAASLVVNTASLATLIAGTVQAGQVAGRMGGDESLVEDFCESTEMDLNLAAEFEAQKAKLWQAREAARIAMEEAEAQLDEDKAVIEACRAGLGTALSESSVNLVGGGTCSLAGTYGSFCPALVTYLNQYTEFQADMSSLYPTLYAAEWALAETEEGIAEMEAKMAATNRNLADVQAEINAAVASYQEALEKAGLSGAALANAVAQKRADLETSYDEDYQNAVSELQALQTLKTTQQTAVSNAKAELETAIAGLTDPASVSNETRCGEQEPDEPPPPLVACAEKYYELCGEAYQLIAKPVTTTETVTINTADGGSYTMNYTKEYTGQFHAHWTDYESKKTLFETADEIHGEFAATPPPAAPECSPAGNDGTVKVWSVTDAVEVLRRVDKRSVLQ